MFAVGLLLVLTLALTGDGVAQEKSPAPSVARPTIQPPTATPSLSSQLPSQPPAQLPPHVPSQSPVGELPAGIEEVVTQLSVEKPAPLRHGVLIETLAGEAVMNENADQAFNPASAIKLATALSALRGFGPHHRFTTAVWTDGTFDRATGTITGDLIISGRDPSFHYEHAVMLAREMNLLGIRTVTGDLIVAPRFTMNFSSSSLRSGERLYDTLDATRRPAAAARMWSETRQAAGVNESLQSEPSVAVMGAVYVEAVPPRARMLLTHRSSQLVDVLKVLLCYSNNFMADRLGDALGGAPGLQRFLITELGIPEAEVRLASTSGLGVNRLTPRAMMRVYRELVAELAKHRLTPADILPVAGVDPGTLQRRFEATPAHGSIIAKTGTLNRTDGGASALVGQMSTQGGETLFFVIFNQRGSVRRFRDAQDRLIAELQNERGGPAAFAYSPHVMAMRLVNTELDRAKQPNTDEYESIDN